VLVVQIEADSCVVGRRVVKLSVVPISLTLRGFKINYEVVFRYFSVGVKVYILILIAASCKLYK
jgi:hypothetical protein